MAATKAVPLFDAFRRLNIEFEEHFHTAVFNMEAMCEVLGPEVRAKGSLVKNMFYSDKKKRAYLITALHETKINIKSLSAKLGAPGLRMADANALMAKLGVDAGSVTPLAVINDPNQAVTIVFDDKIRCKDYLLVHPLHNEATVVIAKEDIVKFIESDGRQIKWIDFADQGEENANVQQTKPTAVTPKKGVPTKVVDHEAAAASGGGGAEAHMGISVSKATDFSEWYTQVITKGEMIQYYDISGCYIIRPWAFAIWEAIQAFIDAEIKKLGVKNGYFPMFVTAKKLEAEQSHVEGFSPEVAWVTKYGTSELAEPIALRPTSETIMYPAYAKWIRSHRDLPLKINQWNTVVRWEFKQPTPFIRTREFLWQEGHTAHGTQEEAKEFAFKILDVYARVYEELLAVPVVRGIKSEGEKFAGADMTSTIEAFVPQSGRGVQAATSHYLGTNFAKMFDITFEDKEKKKQLVHQTSWGLTTRSIGVAVMTHGDDTGLILPPAVAPTQVVVVPIMYKDADSSAMLEKSDELLESLKECGARAEVDDRENYTPGWKYNYWEVKGVPLRIELGPRDMKNGTVRLVRRDNKEKTDISQADIGTVVPKMLDEIQKSMLTRARKDLEDSIVTVREWDEVAPALNHRKLVMAPWQGDEESEELIKARTSGSTAETEAPAAMEEGNALSNLSGAMKPLCFPLEQKPLEADAKCFITGQPASRWCIFGRSY